MNSSEPTPKSSNGGNRPAYSVTYLLSSFFWTSVFCLAIAILLWVLEISRPFWLSAGIAFCIGWTIFIAQIVLCPLLEKRIGMLAASALATALGLIIAIGLVSIFFSQSGFAFVGLDPGAAALALFFGVLGSVVFTNMYRVHEMREALSTAELAQLNTQRRLTESKLKTLQAQIEPHFLFNTLSTAMGLIRTDPAAAEETLQQLTTLLRNSLGRTRESDTTLGQELELVRAYLRIQQIRMGSRLQFEVSCPTALSGLSLSPLLVQPLVENSLTHGLEPAERGGTITVAVDQIPASNDLLRITVADTGLGLNENPATAGNGAGLANVRERLRSMYGTSARLQLSPNTPEGVIATLQIPLNQLTEPQPKEAMPL